MVEAYISKIKAICLRVRDVLLSTVWLSFEFRKLNKYLNELSCVQVKPYMYSTWSRKARFFTALKGSDEVFVKLYINRQDVGREASVLNRLALCKGIKFVPNLKACHVINEGVLLIIERVKGVSLTSRIHGMAFEDFKSIIGQFLVILDEFNAASLVHCDIRPDNIMISDSGDVKVIDFEYAVCATDEENKDLKFENFKVLKNLGGDYSQGNYIWDDAFSFDRISNEILDVNVYSQEELVELSILMGSLSDLVGKHEYKILGENDF